MKKFLAIVLTSVMVLGLCSVFSFAEEAKTFSIDYVNAYYITNEAGTKTAGDAIYLYTPAGGATVGEAAETMKLEWWNVYVFDYNTAKSRYEVKEFLPAGAGLFKDEVAIPTKGFVIAAHQAGNERIDESLKTIGMHVAITGFKIDTVEKHDTYGFTSQNTITIGGEAPAATETEATDPTKPDKTVVEKVMETIKIDGKFDDNGWAANGWKKVDSTNGKWQTAIAEGETRSESFQYQMRTDGENLYIGFKVNAAPLATEDKFGNGNGSNLRVWFYNVDSNYLRYNYFVDFSYKVDGSIGFLAKKNTDPVENKGVDLEAADLAKITAKSTKGTGYWYVEASIPLAVVNADKADGIKMFLTFSTPKSYNDEGEPVQNNALTFGNYGGTEENRNAKAPYNAWDKDTEISIKFSDIALKEIVVSPDTKPAPDKTVPQTGDATVVFVLIALATLAGGVVAVKRNRA